MTFHSTNAVGGRFGLKKITAENLSEMPNDRNYVIVRQANFGKE
jgi:hypothetical protein